MNLSSLTDEDLVKKTLEESDFFGELINRYEKRLYVYLKRFGFESKDCEDFLQEVFIKVYKNLNAFDTDLKFSSWIYRITHNFAISMYRKKRDFLELNESYFQEFLIEDDFLKDIDRKIESKIVLKILNRLDLKYREVLILKYFEDKDYSEISDILKKPIGTVSTLINRAKKQFKIAYEEIEYLNIHI